LKRKTVPFIRTTLWLHPNFLRFWSAETISLFGTQVTLLALPTVAIVLLHANVAEVGVLNALQWIAFLIVGPLSGVMVDRLSRRTIMIVADLGRLVALGSVPLLFALGVRTLLHLYVVALIVSMLTVFFDVAYQSFLPDIVEQEALVEGNAKLALGEASSRVGGPALAGLLIQAVGTVMAIAADAVSYLLSALLIVSIRQHSLPTVLDPRHEVKSVLTDIREGIVMVIRHPLLRPIALANTGTNFGYAVVDAVLLLFVYRELRLSPGIVGITFAIGNIGFIVGALIARRMAYILGVGITLNITSFIGASAPLLIPLSVFGNPVLVLALWRFLFGFQLPIYNILSVSLRQAVTSRHLQGRMNATMRTMSFGALGIGALVGGLLGIALGLIPTIVIGGCASVIGTLPLLERTVRTQKEQP